MAYISPENFRELYDSIESRSVSKIVTSFMTIEPLRDEIKRRILPRRKRRTRAEMEAMAASQITHRQQSAFQPVTRPLISRQSLFKRKSRKSTPSKLDSLLDRKFPNAQINERACSTSPPSISRSSTAQLSTGTLGFTSPAPSDISHHSAQSAPEKTISNNPSSFFNIPELNCRGVMAQSLQLAYWNHLAMISSQLPYSNTILMQNQMTNALDFKRLSESPNNSSTSTSPQLKTEREQQDVNEAGDGPLEVVDTCEDEDTTRVPTEEESRPLSREAQSPRPQSGSSHIASVEINCVDCHESVLLAELSTHLQDRCSARQSRVSPPSEHMLGGGQWESCSICSETVPAAGMMSHIRLRHSIRDETFRCDICQLNFKNKSTLKRHKITHSVDGGHPCNWCGKIFAKPELLRRHELIHTETTKTLWPCPKCNKGFSNKYNLAVHDRMHTGEKPFTCLMCPETFRVKCSMQNHMKSKHPDAYFMSMDSADQPTEI